ncbi:hypothetical protein GCM10012319_28250 [Comamonas sp. KCTC 72670]|nr:hypothetical protein GCM10012319_28250 [Comamonas sp. KCTC 72670]
MTAIPGEPIIAKAFARKNILAAARSGDRVEAPTCFDIWGELKQGHALAVVRWMREELGLPLNLDLDFLRTAERHGGMAVIGKGLGWNDARALVDAPPDFVVSGTMKLFVSHCEPMDRHEHCLNHEVYFNRKACPICTRDYMTTVLGGMYIAADKQQVEEASASV